jgi:hypothetical protein
LVRERGTGVRGAAKHRVSAYFVAEKGSCQTFERAQVDFFCVVLCACA